VLDSTYFNNLTCSRYRPELGLTAFSFCGAASDFGIWVVIRSHGDIDIDDNAQRTFKIIRSLISQKVAHHQNSQDQHDDTENRKVKIQRPIQTPSYDNN
jgi:hypothetical protein